MNNKSFNSYILFGCGVLILAITLINFIGTKEGNDVIEVQTETSSIVKSEFCYSFKHGTWVNVYGCFETREEAKLALDSFLLSWNNRKIVKTKKWVEVK